MPQQTVEKWDVFEAEFGGPKGGSPYLDVAFDAIFRHKAREIRVPGFYDGDGIYRLRFMPEAEGEWRFETRSATPALNGQTGSFTVTPPSEGNHGPVRVRNKFHFAYADGTPFLSFGTTCYAWTHQPEAEQEKTLKTLSGTRFNKIRMGVSRKTTPITPTSRCMTFTNSSTANAISTGRTTPPFAISRRRSAGCAISGSRRM